jgi:hypothetical protein
MAQSKRTNKQDIGVCRQALACLIFDRRGKFSGAIDGKIETVAISH